MVKPWANLLPSSEELHRRFTYDPLTGVLMNKVGRFKGCPAGPLKVRIGTMRYRIHRVAWKMMTGDEPPDYIDHEDLDETNMIWKNLRAADSSSNAQNRRGLKRKLNIPRGVYPYGTHRWIVFYMVSGVKKEFYRGSDYREACRVSYEAARELHGEFFRDQRTEFDKIYGYREPQREWYPDGPFIEHYMSTCSRKETQKKPYLRPDGTPKGIYKFGKAWGVRICTEGKLVGYYHGPSYDEAVRVAIDVHERLEYKFDAEGRVPSRTLSD